MLFEGDFDVSDEGKKKTETVEFKFNITEALQKITDIRGVLESNFPINPLNMSAFTNEFTSVFNTLETQLGKIANQFGGDRNFAESIRHSIVDATVSVKELGGSMEDVANIQMGVIKGLQTQTILNKDAYAELFAVAKLAGGENSNAGQVAGDMIRKFTDAGYGLYNVGGEVTKIVSNARELGVSAVAIYKQINDNMGKLALYNFANGVQGMSEMAAKAAALRIDMKTTLDLADKLFEPEKAIEMAASFQRLGVQVTNLLDPYKLMDMARNDPAELQKSLLEATKQLTYFDEKNQRMAILPGAQATLRELGKELGISSEELAKMALSSASLERKMKEITFPSTFADDKSKEMIANLAQLGEKGTKFEGKYVVDLGAGELKEVSKLNAEDRQKIVDQQKEANKSAIELQKDANGLLRTLVNVVQSRRGMIPAQLAASTGLNKGITSYSQAALSVVDNEAARNLVGLQTNYKGSPMPEGVKTLAESLQTMITSEIGTFMTDPKKALADIVTKFEEIKNNASLGGIGTSVANQLSKVLHDAQEMQKKNKGIPIDAEKIYEKIFKGIDKIPGLDKLIVLPPTLPTYTPPIVPASANAGVNASSSGYVANSVSPGITNGANPAYVNPYLPNNLQSAIAGQSLINNNVNNSNTNGSEVVVNMGAPIVNITNPMYPSEKIKDVVQQEITAFENRLKNNPILSGRGGGGYGMGPS